MKILKTLVCITVLTFTLSPQVSRADHWNDWMRYLGWGWSDGYHACPGCGQISASNRGHLDLNAGPRHGHGYYAPRVVPGSIYGLPTPAPMPYGK